MFFPKLNKLGPFIYFSCTIDTGPKRSLECRGWSNGVAPLRSGSQFKICLLAVSHASSFHINLFYALIFNRKLVMKVEKELPVSYLTFKTQSKIWSTVSQDIKKTMVCKFQSKKVKCNALHLIEYLVIQEWTEYFWYIMYKVSP